jgi:hypothetical protein
VFCPLVLRFCKRKTWHLLLVWDKSSYTGSFCDISMWMCIITPIGSFPLFLFILP